MIVESALIVGGLSWVFDKALEHTVGATAHEFIREFVHHAVHELGDPQERERNHDIARAVRGAQLDALEAVLDGFAIMNAPRWDRVPDATTQHFLGEAATFCRRARSWLNDEDRELDFAPERSLRASIEGLLADQPALVAAGARSDVAGLVAEDAVLTELATELKLKRVPDDFDTYLRAGAGRGHPRFLDLFGAEIAARLKDRRDTRFRDILQIGWLADLKAVGFETNEALARVETQFDGLLADVAEIRRMLREVVDRLTGELRLSNAERMALAEELAKAKTELNGTNVLVAGFLETMLGRAVPPERFAATLFSMVADLRKADAQIDGLKFSRNLTPQLAPMLERAEVARDAGRLDELAAVLADITRTQREARKRLEAHAREVAEELRQRREGEAESAAAEGALARARLAYREAAAHYRAAAEALFEADEQGAWGYVVHAALALFAQGEEFGDNPALADAIRLYRDEVLPRASRRDRSLDWAATQMKLGTALSTLGERESGTARLEEAVTAYRAALLERTRERVPLDWAATQMNLGTALLRLGERESGTARLEEAVTACRAALLELTRERVPLDWAATQTNLGNALSTLGERESGTARLEEAVLAYRAALEERTRDRVPLDWAATQNNLGTAFVRLGERESGTARLEEAVLAYRAALEERTRDRVPLDWAVTQTNLGTALLTLGERETGTARLEEAVSAYRAALEERTRDRVPLDWAVTQNNLGTALWRLGERESGTARLEAAVAAYDGALEIFSVSHSEYYETICRSNREQALALIEDRRK